MNSGTDRSAIYHNLHEGQLAAKRDTNAHSARRFFEILSGYLQPKSMLDVGCGLGTWMREAQVLGMEVAGVEGPWCEVDKLEIDKSLVTITDLEQPIDLGRRFDLAVSLEVGEHLSKDAAPHLVRSLTKHADHVIFSAAVHFQGGHHHVNEQFLDFWIDLFQQEGFVPLDIFRGTFWKDESIHWWLRQNAIFFVRAEAVEANPKLKAESLVNRPMDIILPAIYYSRVAFGLDQITKLHGALRLLYEGKAKLRETPDGIVVDRI